jgi:putative transcriptional regulator
MSKILEIAHEMARDLYSVGAMSDVTMRQMDVLCLPPKRSAKPDNIRGIAATNHKIKL